MPSLDTIRGDELRRDLFPFAGDAMRGREAGTLDELRASGWLVEQAHSIGLESAGEDGTYYQWWPMRRIRQSDASVVRLGGDTMHPMIQRARIVAVLNADMIGRNSPDSACLLSMQPLHRNSSDLEPMCLRANAITGRFTLDSLWDRVDPSRGLVLSLRPSPLRSARHSDAHVLIQSARRLSHAAR